MEIKDGVLISIDESDIVNGKIVIPSSVKKISSTCNFSDTYILDEVEMEEGVEEIGDAAFKSSLIKKVKFPKSLKIIGKSAFEDCKYLKKADLPENIQSIDEYAFKSTLITKVKLPASLKKAGEGIFMDCRKLVEANIEAKLPATPRKMFIGCNSLRKVTLPKEMTTIETGAFMGCPSLTSIDLSNIEDIQDDAFRCSLRGEISLDRVKHVGVDAFAFSPIRKVHFSDSIKNIEKFAFANSNLMEVQLPNSLSNFGERVFGGCEKLRRVDLNNVTELPEETFSACFKLRKITGGESLKDIQKSCFSRCKSLKDVSFAENVESIGKYAFEDCVNIQSVKLSKIKNIEDCAFHDCYKLKSADISQGQLKELPFGTFQNCVNLRDAKIPPVCEKLGLWCFRNCESLKSFDFSGGIHTLGNASFTNTGLEYVSLPQDIILEGNQTFANCSRLKGIEIQTPSFDLMNLIDCENLDYIKVAEKCHLKGTLDIVNEDFESIQKDKDGFIFSNKNSQLQGCEDWVSIRDFKGVDPLCIKLLWDKRNKLESDIKKAEIRDFYVYMFENLQQKLPTEEFEDFMKNANLTFYKKMSVLKMIDTNNPMRTPIGQMSKQFCTLYYNLGGFDQPQKEKRISKSGKEIEVTVDYAQRTGEFFREQLASNARNIGNLVEKLENMPLDGNKPEFTKFLLDPNNFEEMLQEEANNPGFIASCYNRFEEVQKTNTSNRGGQRQLKPTVKKFVEFFRNETFKGVTSKTANIARTIAPYFAQQSTFEKAVQIYEEKQKLNIPDNILKNPVQDQDVFDYIKQYSEKIKLSASKTTKMVAEMSDTEIVADWLNKSDPKNYILGKLCDCCAHLEGAGYGIMHASIVHPDVQNLVLKDYYGNIIAKSTLYVNREEGYGVFNNVEVNHYVDSDMLLKIHEKFKLATVVFANKYNQENPDKPISKITVGMGNNDLESVITKKDKFEINPLGALHYREFGGNWDGDSSRRQYIVWENEEKE